MSKQKTTRAKTSRSLPVFIADTSSATGGGLSGVTHSSSGLVLEYRRQNQSTWTSVTPVSKTLGTYVSGGIVADGSLAGAYEVDFPDAAFASAAGVEWVALRIRGVANMLPVLIEIELDAVDYQDAAAFGLSRIDATIGSRATQTSVDAIDDFVDTEVAAIKAKTDLIVAFPANFGNLDITVGGAIAELGVNALTANGAGDAIETYVWGALLANHTTANSFGARIIRSVNSNNTVQISGGGSNHIFAVLHDAEPNSIPEDAFVDGALSARVIATDAIDSDAMAASANTEIANAVAATQALSRLDSMIESDGAGQFRFDTIALEMAPAGGGGGGTDWTANERTAIRAILGVPTSGTTPTDPSSGILDEIRDSVGAIGINVYPVSASTPERVAGTTLTFYRDESRSVSVVTDFTLTNLTLQFTVEDQDGNDVYTLNNASINRSGQTFTIPITTAVTGGNGQYRWSMRDITGGGNSVISRGVLAVEEAASNG
jgi:hypothetical protein